MQPIVLIGSFGKFFKNKKMISFDHTIIKNNSYVLNCYSHA